MLVLIVMLLPTLLQWLLFTHCPENGVHKSMKKYSFTEIIVIIKEILY